MVIFLPGSQKIQHDVSGFDMTPMTNGVYDEAVMDVVQGESMLTESVIIKVSQFHTSSGTILFLTMLS